VVLMSADPLEQVLNLVAEGRLSAEEAAPILAALDERPGTTPGGGPRKAPPRDEPPGGFGFNPPPSSDSSSPGASTLRLEVREHGRQVVDLRLPIAMGRMALDRIPGLSGEQVERVREALSSGMHGPILSVDDGENTVRIVIE
jgi:hypothetical protein